MDYWAEVLAFYNVMEGEQLSASAISLWHALAYTIHQQAKRFGWREWFPITVGVLESRSGLKKSAIYDTRNRLRQAGLIEFMDRGGRRCSIYRLCPSAGTKTDTNPTQTRRKPDTTPTSGGTVYTGIERYGEGGYSGEGGSTPLRLLSRTRAEGEPLTEGQKLWLDIMADMDGSAVARDAFTALMTSGAFTREQIDAALRLTADRHARGKVLSPVDYLHAILLNWERSGMRTRAEIEAGCAVNMPEEG